MNEQLIYPVVLGIIAGTIARLIMLRTDYRQYPTYPHGRIIHVALGFIAAFIGAAAVPSVLSQDWSAVTFLGLAAQQFRDVRNMERTTLQNLDALELVPRGTAYIEGIARVFEGRNYLVMMTAIVTTLVATITSIGWGVVAALAMFVIDKINMSGKTMRHIADIVEAPIRFDGPNVWVGDIYIMNVALKKDQQIIEQHGVGIILVPKSKSSVLTLANLGQRQALLHEVSNILGIYRDEGEPALIPMAKRDLQTGKLGVLLLPEVKDISIIKKAIEEVPILESAVRLPKESGMIHK